MLLVQDIYLARWLRLNFSLLNKMPRWEQTQVGTRLGVGSLSVDTGTGKDGAITVSTTKTIDSDAIASGRTSADAVNFNIATSIATAATTINIGATLTGLAVGDEILIINLRETSGDYSNVGNMKLNILPEFQPIPLTLDSPLTNAYDGTTQRLWFKRVPLAYQCNCLKRRNINRFCIQQHQRKRMESYSLEQPVQSLLPPEGILCLMEKGYAGGAANPPMPEEMENHL